jgi:hypothetical protein
MKLQRTGMSPRATSISLLLTGIILAAISFLSVWFTPDLTWHPGRDAELRATYSTFQATGTLLIKLAGSGSNGTQSNQDSTFVPAVWDDDPGAYVLASLMGQLTQSDSPYPGLKLAQAALVSLPMLWLPTAIARLFRNSRSGYALLLVPPILWLVNNGSILLGTMYGLSDFASPTRVYALYGIGASVTFLSLSILLLLSTYRLNIFSLLSISLVFGILVSVGNLIRSHSGIGIALGVGFLWWINSQGKKNFLKAVFGALVTLLTSSLLVFGTMSSINSERSIATGQDASEYPISHVTWHPLYLGLSFPQPISGVDSKLGVVWADEFGWEKARSIEPDVLINTLEYDQIIKEVFIETVSSQPYEALYTYFGKLILVLEDFLGIIAVIIAGVLLSRSSKRGGQSTKPPSILVVIPTLIYGFVPPVLVMPLLYYYSELSAALGILLSVAVGSLVTREASQRFRKVKSALEIKLENFQSGR